MRRVARGAELSHGGRPEPLTGTIRAPAGDSAVVPVPGSDRRTVRKKNDPAMAGSQVLSAMLRRYCRNQVWVLQMKATQPDTSSFLPPSTSAIFDL